jgi:hypothetical protein
MPAATTTETRPDGYYAAPGASTAHYFRGSDRSLCGRADRTPECLRRHQPRAGCFVPSASVCRACRELNMKHWLS